MKYSFSPISKNSLFHLMKQMLALDAIYPCPVVLLHLNNHLLLLLLLVEGRQGLTHHLILLRLHLVRTSASLILEMVVDVHPLLLINPK